MQTPDATKLEYLVLARLSGRGNKPPKPSDVRRSIRPYVEHVLTPAEWRSAFNGAVDRLSTAGLITAKPLQLTDAGRDRLRGFFGLDRDVEWRTIRSRFLPARALDLTASSDRVRKRLGKPDGLRGCIITRHHALATDPTPTLDQALDAWIWRELGIDTDEKLTLNRLKQHVLRKALGIESKVGLDKLKHLLAARAVGAQRTDANSLRTRMIQGWVCEASPDAPTEVATDTAPVAAPDAPAEPPPVSSRDGADGDDLAALAAEVHSAAMAATEPDRFGDNVFIAAIWRQVRDSEPCRGMDFARFKAALITANQRDLVSLHRADLVAAMPEALVAESEIQYLNATFHFVKRRP